MKPCEMMVEAGIEDGESQEATEVCLSCRLKVCLMDIEYEGSKLIIPRKPRVDVVTIRKLYAEGLSQREIAEELGISLTTVNKRARGSRPQKRCLYCSKKVEGRRGFCSRRCAIRYNTLIPGNTRRKKQ